MPSKTQHKIPPIAVPTTGINAVPIEAPKHAPSIEHPIGVPSLTNFLILL